MHYFVFFVALLLVEIQFVADNHQPMLLEVFVLALQVAVSLGLDEVFIACCDVSKPLNHLLLVLLSRVDGATFIGQLNGRGGAAVLAHVLAAPVGIEPRYVVQVPALFERLRRVHRRLGHAGGGAICPHDILLLAVVGGSLVQGGLRHLGRVLGLLLCMHHIRYHARLLAYRGTDHWCDTHHVRQFLLCWHRAAERLVIDMALGLARAECILVLGAMYALG